MSKNERRKHSPEFKQLIVDEVESGRKSVAEVCREHRLAGSMVKRWSGQLGPGGSGLPVRGGYKLKSRSKKAAYIRKAELSQTRAELIADFERRVGLMALDLLAALKSK